MIGLDIPQALPVEAEEVGELTEDVREPFKRLNESEKETLFYSCLRGFGYERRTKQVRDRRKG